MDADEPQFEEPLLPRRTWKSRLRQGVGRMLRPFRILKVVWAPLSVILRKLRPLTRVFSPLADRLMRLPGAGLLWTYTHRKLVGLTVGLVLLLSVPYLFREMAIRAIVPPPPPPTAEETLTAVEHQDWPKARSLAEELRNSDTLTDEESGVPPYVLGLATLQDAEQYEGVRRKGLLAIAARHLAESQAKGFPHGHEDEGLFLLGQSLLLSEQQADAKPVLEEGLKSDPTRTKEYRTLLAQLYSAGPERDLKKAKEHNGALLASKLPSGERNDAWLRQCRIVYDLGETTECMELLAKVPNEAKNRPEVHGLRGQLLLRAARSSLAANENVPTPETKAKYQEAINAFRQALGRGMSDLPANREAMYLIGICLQESGDDKGGAEQFARTLKQFPESDEGLAASVQLAKLYGRLDRDDEAIALYEQIAKAIKSPERFYNPWLKFDDLRNSLAAAQQTFMAKPDFAHAIQLAEVASPILPKERAVQLSAQGYREWAGALKTEATQLSGSLAQERERLSREKLRLAGQRFTQLAELRLPTRFYADDLWDSAQAALSGRDYARAIEMFQKYSQAEPRRRKPQALLAIGESQIALQHPTAALSTLRECLANYPTDPAAYRARLLCCRAILNQRDQLEMVKEEDAGKLYDEAVLLLSQNLNGDALSPASLEYRDSLYALGKLHFERGMELETRAKHLANEAAKADNSKDGNRSQEVAKNSIQQFSDAHDRYEDAVTRLDEAISRYPDAPAAVEGRYLIAEAFRHASIVPREQMKTDTIESTRIAHGRQMQQMLNQAVVHYQQLQEILNRRQERAELSPLELSILRNSYFLRGASLFEAGRFEDAILAYSTVVNRYQDIPEVMEAYLQIAHCYWRLNRLVEFQGTISQAEVVLKGMPADDRKPDRFQLATSRSRQAWEDHLKWLKSVRNSNAVTTPVLQTASRTP